MAKFTVFDEEAYMALIEDTKVFTKIEDWLTEDAWEALEKYKNPSIALHDLTHFCDDPEAFKDYGLSDLSEHSQAVQLMDFIQRLGF